MSDLSEAYIQKLIEKYAATPEGRRRIKAKYGIDYDPKFSNSSMIRYGEMMKKTLFDHINPIISSIKMEDIIVGTPYVDKNGQMRIDISFNEGGIHRESLYPQKYTEGIKDIVLLFAKGYDAHDSIHGTWHRSSGDIEIWSRTHREPNDFMKKAVDSFNAKAKGIAVAILNDEYK